MNFNIVETKSTIITDDLYEKIKHDYINSDLTVKEIRHKYNLTHIDWKNLSNQIRTELGIKGRPVKNAKHYYKARGKWRITKWVDGKAVHIGEVCCNERTVQEIVKLCENVNWDIDECKRIVRGGWYYLI